MWYLDEYQKEVSAECDAALDKGYIEKLKKLSEKCKELAANTSNHEMIQAKYYYDSFTCLSNYMRLQYKVLSKDEKEHLTEKIIYLCRKSLNIMNAYKKKNIEDVDELAHFRGIYYPTIVNYCNVLFNIGRLPKAIYTIKPIADKNFGMAIGNLGMELFDYAYFEHDNYNQRVIYSIAKQLLIEAIDISDPSVHDGARRAFQKKLDQLTNIPDSCPEIKNNQNDNAQATKYYDWVSNNGLALNTINDATYSNFLGNDSLHLPNMLVSIKEKSPRYHGIFNQIKQEYVSARYLLYEGIIGNETHFSDSGVYLVNTLDYPVYSINIEKVKSSYRAIYSLFDRIAYFLNDYFSLGFTKRNSSFNLIWSKKSELHDFAEQNHLLDALKWINKDLRSKSVSKFEEYIDPILHRTYEIRNAMEHRYLKIIIDEIEINNDKTEFDPLAFAVSRDEFHELAINLLRTSREAIILTVMAINIEERKKEEATKDEIIPSIPLDSYEDDWKV